MAEYIALAGQRRTVLGKKVARLRRDGYLPGVIYGPVIDEPEPVSVEERDFEKIYRATGSTDLVNLTVDGQARPVFIWTVDRHPVKGTVLNIEFYAPNLSQPVAAKVPLVITGELDSSVAGTVAHGRAEVEVRALPDRIPHEIYVDISGLSDANSTIMVGDLEVPDGVEILTTEEDVVARIETPAVAVDEALEQPAEEEQVAELAEGPPAAVNEGAEPEEDS